MHSYVVAIILVLLAPVFSGAAEPELRTWTSTSGSKMEARFLSLQQGVITLVRSNGKRLTLKVAQLSEEDQVFVKDLQKKLDEGPRGEAKISGIDATPGEISEPIACLQSEWHYRLYLPEAFHTGREWPVWFVMSPGGGSKSSSLERYIAGAERLGCILALSVESRNKFAEAYTAMYAMVDDIYARAPASEELSFASGFSGGSRSAYVLAEYRPNIAGVLACGSGYGIYIDDDGFRSANLPRSTYIYSLIGTNCFNRDEAVRTHNKVDENFRLRFFPGKHAWAGSSLIEVGMARVYGEALLVNTDPKFDAYRRIFSRSIIEWVEEMAEERPWEALSWARFLESFPGDTGVSAQAASLIPTLEEDPRTGLASKAEKAIQAFAREYFSRNINSDNGKIPNPEREAAAEALAAEFEGLPHAEIILRLGKPS
ncbi:SHD1 domain-containing protein [Verrucomicrobiales bacterium]|nr:SHD1 domain-containing protein [Verrucomicrobiales bacterium]